MEFLNSVISQIPEFKKLLGRFYAGELPLEASGLSMVHKALLFPPFCVKQKERWSL